jgi:isopentenyl diphosphate isomerase/L-lactate dehydrogenase-like FMN-dependent dehydrogenase
MPEAFNLDDFEAIARTRMAPEHYDYVAGGAGEEHSLAENRAAFRRYQLRPRVLVDVSRIELGATLLGTSVPLPVGVAPMAMQGLAHSEGELPLARGAAAAGALYCLSTVSTRSLEEVAAVSTGPRWFQLYVNNRPQARRLVERAAAAGYSAIILTVDLPELGYRERDMRNGFELAGPWGNLPASDLEGKDDPLDMRGVALRWADLAEIRSWSSLPVVIKGILTAEDALLAVEHHADGIVVSNHGGRQLDAVVAPVDALAEVVAAVDGRAEVYLDGGVRRATDVLIALALGARAVFIGRPFFYALSLGEDGVARAFAIVRDELELAMALLGTPSLDRIGAEHLRRDARIGADD